MLPLREARSFSKTSNDELSKLQGTASIGISGAMKTVATKVFIGTPNTG
jgi:hypothetical protein